MVGLERRKAMRRTKAVWVIAKGFPGDVLNSDVHESTGGYCGHTHRYTMKAAFVKNVTD
jgi:hypothetical protein